MMRASQVVVVAIAAFGVVGVSACGAKSVSGADLAKQVSSKLEAQVGQKPDKVTCPNLPAKVGATVTCKLTADGKTYDTVVKATKVDGSTVSFSITVANKAS